MTYECPDIHIYDEIQITFQHFPLLLPSPNPVQLLHLHLTSVKSMVNCLETQSNSPQYISTYSTSFRNFHVISLELFYHFLRSIGKLIGWNVLPPNPARRIFISLMSSLLSPLIQYFSPQLETED